MSTDALQQEWQVLQVNSERYEAGALAIKLVAVATAVACMVAGPEVVVTGALIAVLWLQEGIFRTSQARLVARLTRIETLISSGTGGESFRLHLDWLANRPGTAGLVSEYFSNALRPTVGYPYAVLILILVLRGWTMG